MSVVFSFYDLSHLKVLTKKSELAGFENELGFFSTVFAKTHPIAVKRRCSTTVFDGYPVRCS